MSELKKVVVVEVSDSEIATQISVAELDYSAIYEAKAYKQTYENEEWVDSAEAMEKYEESLAFIGGLPAVDDEIELWVDVETGKAYFKEGKGFKQIEKPALSLKRLKSVPIVEVKDSPKARSVIVEHEGVYYAFNFNTGQWIESKEKFIPNKVKLIQQKKRFNDLFEEVGVNWDNAIEIVEQRVKAKVPLVVDCTVKKNQLDPKSKEGWLEPLALDADEQKEFIPNLEPKRDETEKSDDLPF